MSALDGIIKYKQLEQMERETNRQAITGIFDTFQKARQTSMLLDMEKKKIDVSLAKSGLRFGESGEIEGDPGLIESLGLEARSEADVKGGILSDIEAGRTLTPGAKSIYEDVIKKKEKSLTQDKRETLGFVRSAIAAKKPLKEINKYISGKGYELEEFDDELKGYDPTMQETVNAPGYFGEKSIVNRANIFGIGQKFDKRTKIVNGKKITYEKREDGLWHPLD